MTKRELVQMALDALNQHCSFTTRDMPDAMDNGIAAIVALEAELAKPEPEPAGYFLEYPENKWAKHEFRQIADIHAGHDDLRVVPLYRKEDL